MSGSSTLKPNQRRFLGLYAPFLPCDRLAWQIGARPDGPHAFVEKRSNAMRLTALDPRGLALGLTPGLSLADARARVPELVTHPHEPRADRVFLERLADACDRYSPAIALDPPGGITIDITGCTHLFGSEAALTANAIARFAPFATLTTAIADTPEAAQALARYNCEGVAALPVAALRLGEDATKALLRAGLKTVGDLASRPSGAFAARFGAQALDRLARILGQVDSRLTPRRALPPVMTERRFAEPVASVDFVMTVISELLTEGCITLAERHRGCRRCSVALFRSDGDVRCLTIETGLPVRDAAVILRLLDERIDTLSDPLDPGFGFDIIRVGFCHLQPLKDAQLSLEDESLTDDALAALIDRLSTRFGRNRIRRLVPADTHIPERRMLALPALDAIKPVPWPAPESGEPPLRPLHLFDPPQRIEVIAEVPDAPPHRFRWRRNLHEVTRAEGPERISAEWWRRRDGAGLTRDYYRVEDSRGRRFWIFRHGLYGTEKTQPVWYLHGLFA